MIIYRAIINLCLNKGSQKRLGIRDKIALTYNQYV